jgi:two-component system, response regulator YesN
MHRLVIVDDEKLIREGLVSYIDWGSLGIRVAGICGTAQEALEMVRETEADLVLTDIKMPGMDGIELLKRLKGINARCEVVFVSAYRNFEYARKALRYGAFDYIMKPIEEAALYETFRRCVEHIANTPAGEPDAAFSEGAAIGELRLYLHAGIRDPEVWRRLAPALHVTAGGSLRLVIVRPAGPGKEEAAEAEGDALRRALQTEGAMVFSIRLGESETVILAFSDRGGHTMPRPSTRYADTLATLASTIVGSTLDVGDRDPTELYHEASWALVALVANPSRGSMQFAELRAALAKRPPAATTPEQLAKEIMGADEPDHAELVWRLFAGLVRDGQACDPSFVRLEMARVVENAMSRLAEYPMLRPEVTELQGLGQLIARERSVLEIYAATRVYLERLRSIVRERLSPGISRRINEAINFVRDDPASDVSLAGVARRLLVSPGYLSRAFSREMSESFTHFRSRMRIERAKKLLLDHRHKVYEVAALVGFSDVTHFTKVFTKLAGVPPSEYRKRSEGRTGNSPE